MTQISENHPLDLVIFSGIKRRLSAFKALIANTILPVESFYHFYLNNVLKAKATKIIPNAPWYNGVLKNLVERDSAIQQVKNLGLPLVEDLPKNWDALAALALILQTCPPQANILDAGAELYSRILPWLYLYGYRNLQGINLVFDREIKRGPIKYCWGDITKTGFNNNSFDAITCMSVIEHGVDLRAYFHEMSRLLKPKGILITSTDYYQTPIDTKNQFAYGVPIHIFTQEEILSALEIASEYGLYLQGTLDLSCEEKVVTWQEFNLSYTFVIFTLEKR